MNERPTHRGGNAAETSAGSIVAIGGATTPVAVARLDDYLLEVAGAADPTVCLLATATGDHPDRLAALYRRFASKARVRHLELFPHPHVEDLASCLQGVEVIYVDGGSTANLLALWRLHRLDGLLRQAYGTGALLCGTSAGAICWFEHYVTDSFGPEHLRSRTDGLGLLQGTACTHYVASDARRRPAVHRAVRNGHPAALGIDDDAAVRFKGGRLAEVVAVRDGATAYRVEMVGSEVVEHAYEARHLGVGSGSTSVVE
jgi:dipeptidase E